MVRIMNIRKFLKIYSLMIVYMADKITQNDDDETLEVPEVKKKESRILKGHLPSNPPPKKERTPAQIAAFEKARASREANIKKKEADAKRLAEYDAMLVKQKLVEKANKMKLKTMKKIETIESISSDEEDEVVIEKPKKRETPPVRVPAPAPVPPAAPVPPKPKFPFKFV